MRLWLKLSLLAAVLGARGIACADGFIIINGEPDWPHPRPPHPAPWTRPYAPLEVTYHHVRVNIDGQVATTSVDQEFYNPDDRRLEGTYLFPVPRGAQINKFSMEIGGRQVEAELLPADKARRLYEDIVRKLRDPALMEYADRDVFKVRIFPIEPHSAKRITLSYSQVLKSDSGLVSYVYPLNTEKFSAQPIKSLSIKVDLCSDRPLKSIYSPSHAVEVKRDGPRRAIVGYEAADVRPDTDFTLYFAPEKSEVGLDLLTSRAAGEDGYFLLLASPGVDVPDQAVVSRDVAFVLDTSGSMAGRKMEQARKALQFCIENLNDGDRFEILRFSTEVEPLFQHLVDASRAHRDRAEAFLREVKPIGGTAIDDALQAALALRPAASDRPFVVIFITDGQPTVGVTDENRILANLDNRRGSTRIFCFGLGTDVNTHLLDRITEATGAFSQYILPDEDLEVKLSDFFTKIKAPVLASPVVRFSDDVRARLMYPSPLPDLFKGGQLLIVGRYSGHGDTTVTIDGTVNGRPKQFSYQVHFPQTAAGNDFIPRLWATRRTGYLLEEIRLHGENPELREEVTELARTYGIVTPYTAYLIVEDEARRDVPTSWRSLQGLDQDAGVRAEAARSWSELNRGKDGGRAVGGAQLNYYLKAAEAPLAATDLAVNSAATRSLGIDSASAVGGGPGVTARQKLVQYAQQSRFVNGRNFFQNGAQWTDTEAQKHPRAQTVRIQFNSPEYFAFAAGHPHALPWLALGQNVQFILDGTLYDIHE
jgi:Ca-activated chloride channel family protein